VDVKSTATSRKRAEVAESKRRGEDAVDERLDEELDEDVLHADELDDEDLADDEDLVGATSGSRSRPKRASGGDLSTRPPGKSKTGDRPGMFARLRNFLREIISELRKVIWPTRNELLTYTAVVIVFVAIVSSLVAGLDYVFAKVIIYTLGNGGKK